MVIYSIKNAQGILVENTEAVTDAFVDYYSDLLGTSQQQSLHVKEEVVHMRKVLSEEQQRGLIALFSNDDIKKAIWAIDGNKAPGYEGYTSQFYKDSWEVVGDDVCMAV